MNLPLARLGGIQQLRGQNFAIFWPLLHPTWTVFIPWAWTKTDIFTPSLPHLVHVVIEWPPNQYLNLWITRYFLHFDYKNILAKTQKISAKLGFTISTGPFLFCNYFKKVIVVDSKLV